VHLDLRRVDEAELRALDGQSGRALRIATNLEPKVCARTERLLVALPEPRGMMRASQGAHMTAIYTAVATATNGRTGAIKSDDGHLSAPLSLPKELGGPGGAGTNPEQLFAAGYAACFGSALGLVARNQKIAIGEVAITAKVGLVKDDTSFHLEVELHGEFKSIPTEQAHALMEAAHQVCPYSKATHGNITVKLTP
jgi:osmotically inducible protein OsmC